MSMSIVILRAVSNLYRDFLFQSNFNVSWMYAFCASYIGRGKLVKETQVVRWKGLAKQVCAISFRTSLYIDTYL